MTSQSQPPAHLASEDVIINAPMSYAGSAQRIMRIRRRAPSGWQLTAVTLLAVLFVVVVWTLVTAWYLIWGIWLVPYRLLRRGARRRKAEALRHRELLGTIQGSAAASAGAIIAATVGSYQRPQNSPPMSASPNELIADSDRDRVIEELSDHLIAGRLTTDEFEERLSSVHRARTRADLDAVGSDLPPAPAIGPAGSR